MSSNYDMDPGGDPLAPPGDDADRRRRIASSRQQGDNAGNAVVSDLSSSAPGIVSFADAPAAHGTQAWANPAPQKTDVGSGNPNDAYGPGGGSYGQIPIADQLAGNSGAADAFTDMSMPSQNPRPARDPLAPPSTPAYEDVPEGNWAAKLGTGGPGRALMSAIFGNQAQTGAAAGRNALKQQTFLDQAKLYQDQLQANYAKNAGYKQAPMFTDKGALVQDADAPGGWRLIEGIRPPGAIVQDEKPEKQQNAEQILLDPSASPQQKANARNVIQLTHPQIATQTQSADDIQTAAQALVAAKNGDPTAVSTLSQLGGFGNKKTAIFAAARRIDPTFNTSQIERMAKTVNNFTTATAPGSANAQLRSINTFAQHSADLQDAVQALGRTDSQLLNRPLSWVQQQITSNPQMAAFQTALMAPSMEYLRLLNNGGSPYEQERQDMAKLLAPSATVGQVIGSTREMGKIVSKRFDSLNSEFRRGTGHDLLATIPDAISPEGHAALTKLGVNLGGGGGAAPAPAPTGGLTNFHVNPQTGQRIGWDGKAWVPAPPQ